MGLLRQKKNAETKEIQLPTWMGRQACIYAEMRLESAGIKKSDPNYTKEFEAFVQDFAEEAYQNSLTAGDFG